MHYGERLRKIREKGNLSQQEVGDWENISRQGIYNREKKEDPVMSLSAIGKLLNETNTDARFLFGQLDNIGLADIQVSDASASFSEMLKEYKTLKSKESSSLGKRIEDDEELRECVQMLIQNRGLIGRVMGYLDRISEEKIEMASEKGAAYGA